jgi:hypothetical protein
LNLDSPFIEMVPTGGIGNQLFQVAAAFRQAIRLNAKVNLLPHESVVTDTKRGFELEHLRGRARFVFAESSAAKSTFKESSYFFDNKINRINTGTKLTGYFQSWKYFHQNRLLGRFLVEGNPSFRRGLSSNSLEDQIVVHVRRGDYVLEPARSFHGLLSMDYFTEGISVLRQGLGPLPVVIISDCSTTAHSLAGRIPNSSVQNAIQDDWEALGKIASAAGAVISNSSFGWWGAFLGDATFKNCVVPSKWINSIADSGRDLLFQHWIKIPVEYS